MCGSEEGTRKAQFICFFLSWPEYIEKEKKSFVCFQFIITINSLLMYELFDSLQLMCIGIHAHFVRNVKLIGSNSRSLLICSSTKANERLSDFLASVKFLKLIRFFATAASSHY